MDWISLLETYARLLGVAANTPDAAMLPFSNRTKLARPVAVRSAHVTHLERTLLPLSSGVVSPLYD